MLKRGYIGTFHHLSAKHLHGYVAEFCGRHNVRSLDTADQMAVATAGPVRQTPHLRRTHRQLGRSWWRAVLAQPATGQLDVAGRPRVRWSLRARKGQHKMAPEISDGDRCPLPAAV